MSNEKNLTWNRRSSVDEVSGTIVIDCSSARIGKQRGREAAIPAPVRTVLD